MKGVPPLAGSAQPTVIDERRYAIRITNNPGAVCAAFGFQETGEGPVGYLDEEPICDLRKASRLTNALIEMGAFYLDVRNRLIGESEVYCGTLSRAAVEPRAIMKEALLRSVAGFVLFHTHPSDDPSPSTEDLSLTRRMAEAGEMLGVHLLDHIILGSAGRWVSLGRRGAW